MRYFANASTPPVREAMKAGLLSQIVTPAAGNKVTEGVEWIADNSVFGGKYPGDEAYLAWLASRPHREHCRFAVAPDVVGDAKATLERSLPLLARIREIVPVAYVGQDGATIESLPWDQFDAFFIGGSTEWKLGPEAAALAAEAKRRGLWVHMGRVNSGRRLRYAQSIGCDSVDGTFITYGPDVNMPKVLGWIRDLDMSVIDTSLGKGIRSDVMTTTTNDQIKQIQDRDAQARGRVIAAGAEPALDLAQHRVEAVVTAAMMELAACWREQATWWRESGKRGAKGTADELTKAAGRLSGFAVGLSTRPVELPSEPVVHPDVAACAAGGHPDEDRSTLSDGRIICTRCMATLEQDFDTAVQTDLAILDAERAAELPGMWEQSDLTGGQTDIDDVHPPQCPCGRPVCAALYVGLTGDEPIGTQVTVGGVEFTKIGNDPFPSLGANMTNVAAIIDNPFTSPAGPGAGARPATSPLPYSVLPVIASQLEPRTQLSHSFVETYEGCSLKSMLQRASRHGLIGPQRPSWSLVGGSAFHAAVEAIERDALSWPGRTPVSSRRFPPASPESENNGTVSVFDVELVWAAALEKTLAERLAEVAGSAYASVDTWHASQGGKEGYDWWRVEGANMLARYLDFHDAAWRSTRMLLRLQPLAAVAPVPALEQEFTMAIPATASDGTSPLTSRGFIDAVWFTPPNAQTAVGYLDIVDWKTGSRRPTSTFQLGEYAHGLASLLTGHHAQNAIVRGSYWLARKGEYTPLITLADKHPIDELTYRYRQAALGAGLGIATPHVTDMCSACGVRDYCPAGSSR